MASVWSLPAVCTASTYLIVVLALTFSSSVVNIFKKGPISIFFQYLLSITYRPKLGMSSTSIGIQIGNACSWLWQNICSLSPTNFYSQVFGLFSLWFCNFDSSSKKLKTKICFFILLNSGPSFFKSRRAQIVMLNLIKVTRFESYPVRNMSWNFFLTQYYCKFFALIGDYLLLNIYTHYVLNINKSVQHVIYK